jgi:hypothetical protein
VPAASGREIAAGILGARFVSLPGKNHIVLEQDPGGPIVVEEIRSFLSTGARLMCGKSMDFTGYWQRHVAD